MTELSYGPDWYTSNSYAGPKQFDAPAEYSTYGGRYVNHNPEEVEIRIYLRKGQLFLATGPGPGQYLITAGTSTFRPAAPDYNPERISFDSIIEGHALRMFHTGMPFYRRDER